MAIPEDIDYAQLRTIPFAALQRGQPDAVEDFQRAVFDDGFLVLVDHGMSSDQASLSQSEMRVADQADRETV